MRHCHVAYKNITRGKEPSSASAVVWGCVHPATALLLKALSNALQLQKEEGTLEPHQLLRFQGLYI